MYDKVFYTYNEKGQEVRSESFKQDYYTTFNYTPQGNVSSWHFYAGGSPVYADYETYTKPYKNPYLAVPGIEYGFVALNAAYSKWWASGEKLTAYDENGNPAVLFDYDAKQAVWQAGPQNYPLGINNFDLISGARVPFTFKYEHCGCGNEDKNLLKTPPGAGTTKINPSLLLKRNPSKSIKELVKELRQQMKNNQSHKN